MSRHELLLFGAVTSLFPLSLAAQSVISAHSGVIHFFEGSVLLDGQPVEPKFGRFPDIKPGSTLSTDQGRAEVLLTPGVVLRVDENSSIRMVSNQLSDTRIEFVGGSIGLDSANASTDAPLNIAYKTYQVNFKKHGRYRLNSAPAELRVQDGEAEVALASKTVMVKAAHLVEFVPSLEAKALPADAPDRFDRWAEKRSQTLTADNTAAASSDDMSSAIDNAPSGGYGGGGYGAYGGGYGAYDPGAYTVIPATTALWAGGGFAPLWSPLWVYSGSILGARYGQLYSRSPSVFAYRPLPGHIGSGLPASAWPRPVRPLPTPIHRSVYPGAIARPPAHFSIHR